MGTDKPERIILIPRCLIPEHWSFFTLNLSITKRPNFLQTKLWTVSPSTIVPRGTISVFFAFLPSSCAKHPLAFPSPRRSHKLQSLKIVPRGTISVSFLRLSPLSSCAKRLCLDDSPCAKRLCLDDQSLRGTFFRSFASPYPSTCPSGVFPGCPRSPPPAKLFHVEQFLFSSPFTHLSARSALVGDQLCAKRPCLDD